MTIRTVNVEPEPLSGAAWKRIEEAVFSELDRAGGEPVRAAARRGVWGPLLRWSAACAAAAVVSLVVVIVLQQRSGAVATVAEPSRIVTADASAQVTVGRAAITVAPRSAVWVRGHDSQGVQVIVEQGRVDCAVAPRAGRPPFVVQAGDVRVEVVGTRFSVERDGVSVRVAVSKGQVAVFHDGERTPVGPGQAWPAVVHALDRAASVQEAAGDDADAKEQYERAARLEAARPEEAIAIYRRLSLRSGPWAANALFARARLELEQGRSDDARQLLRDYLRRFPAGVNAQDARELLASPGD